MLVEASSRLAASRSLPPDAVRNVVLLALLALPSMAGAAGLDLECLTADQRSEFLVRQGEVTAIAAIEVGPRLRLLRETRAAVDATREAWASCEANRPSGANAEGCSRERAAFDEATGALPVAEQIHKEAMEELREKTLERLKEVRGRFPPCRPAI